MKLLRRRRRIDVELGARDNARTRSKGAVMSKQITCECGYVIRGTADGEVVQGAHDRMRADYPDLLDKVSDADRQGWIEEV
jgi:hypothetical protein